MNKKLSSSATFFVKYLFSLIWFVWLGCETISLYIKNDPDKYTWFLMWLFGSLFIYVCTHNLKSVILSGENLIVSNYLKTIKVPISEIYYIKENRIININPISIYFKNPTEFGSKITFTPASRFYLFPFDSHPIYKELKALINNKTTVSNPTR